MANTDIGNTVHNIVANTISFVKTPVANNNQVNVGPANTGNVYIIPIPVQNPPANTQPVVNVVSANANTQWANNRPGTMAETGWKVNGQETKIPADKPAVQHDAHDPVSMGLPPIPALAGRP